MDASPPPHPVNRMFKKRVEDEPDNSLLPFYCLSERQFLKLIKHYDSYFVLAAAKTISLLTGHDLLWINEEKEAEIPRKCSAGWLTGCPHRLLLSWPH